MPACLRWFTRFFERYCSRRIDGAIQPATCHMSQNEGRGPRKKRSHGGPPIGESKKKYAKEEGESRDRAFARFSQSEKPMAFPDGDLSPKVIDVEWPTNPVPLKAEAEAISKVVKKGEWGWLTDEQVDTLKDEIKDLSISLDQALSLRSAILQEKSVYGFRILQNKALHMKRLYENGDDIVALSKRFDFPPMNLFRAILKARGWSKSKIKESLRAPEKRLNERDLEQFKKAEKADRVSNVDQSETQERAETFEDVLCNYFDSKGVRYRTQAQISSEQMAEHGRPVKTPDILLLDDVRIDGEPIGWVDAKHYYGADVGFQRKKTIKQMARYVEEWGQGAIVFRHGFCANLHIPSTILLDSSPLDLSPLQKKFGS